MVAMMEIYSGQSDGINWANVEKRSYRIVCGFLGLPEPGAGLINHLAKRC